MKTIRSIWTALSAAILLIGCAEPQAQTYYPFQSYPPAGYQSAPPASYSVGVVDQIEVITQGENHNVAGTVIGGIVGGLIGHQIGHGSGQTAATIAGAAGGAVAGHELQERSRGANEAFRVTVRLDNGAYLTVVQSDITDLRTGDRVRVEGDRVYRI